MLDQQKGVYFYHGSLASKEAGTEREQLLSLLHCASKAFKVNTVGKERNRGNVSMTSLMCIEEVKQTGQNEVSQSQENLSRSHSHVCYPVMEMPGP